MAEPVVIDLVADEEDELPCRDAVLRVFPDICPERLAQLVLQHAYQPDAVITSILDGQEKGEHYPTRPQDNPLKRKREDEGDVSNDGDDDDLIDLKEPEAVTAIRSEIAKPDYVPISKSNSYQTLAKTLLGQDFPRIPVKVLLNLLKEKGNLFDTYAFMDEATRNWNEQNRPWIPKLTSSKSVEMYQPGHIENLDMDPYPRQQRAAIAEFRAARELRTHKNAKAAEADEEQANFAEAQRNGQTMECGCCYDEQALNRMAKCNGETIHFFCGNCVRQQAETQVGYSKYELKCLSMDGCSAGFSFAEKKRFLDKGLRTALDRIEQEAVLREAGIENLETCPFCPYAAEYPPVEQDKEFRCEMPDCRKVSCRLCRKETHIPKSCAEVAATEEGLTARREIEEAMSDALIRKCNKCRNPFVKDAGCNKITCTRCGTLHCYVCRETVKDYTHFNDTTRGGKSGQCPLFDESVDQRHQNEVQQAEEAARHKVTKERPDVDNEALRFKVSKQVEEDEKKLQAKIRRRGHMAGRVVPVQLPRGRQPHMPQPGPMPGRGPVLAQVPARAQGPVPAPANQQAPGMPLAFNPAGLVVPRNIQRPNNAPFPPLPVMLPAFNLNRSHMPFAAGPVHHGAFGNQLVPERWNERWNFAMPDPNLAQPQANPNRDWEFLQHLDIDGLDPPEGKDGFNDDEVRRALREHFDHANIPPYQDNRPQGPPENVRDHIRNANQHLRHIKDFIWQRLPYVNDPPLAPPMNPGLDPIHGNGAQAADAP